MSRGVQGVTLLELIVVLAVTGVLAGLTLPRVAGGPDRWVVREAREEVIALLYRARIEARRYGEATVEVTSENEARLEVPGRGVVARWTPSTPGLELDVAGSRDQARIAFGPGGIGRFANATLVVRRGREEARIVVSSYGRVRR